MGATLAQWRWPIVLPISIHAPAWGATFLFPSRGARIRISIHAPRMGGATHHRRRAQVFLHISIHAPRMGARLDAPAFGNFHWTFQSTRPAWGRDQCFIRSSEIFGHFNPRAPHGGATSVLLIVVQLHVFQSTRPAWGRDVHPAHLRHLLRISIHAPRMGARHGRTWISHGMVQFQSTRPAWGRDPRSGLRLQAVPYFNPRAPHGGATKPV